MKKLIFPLLVLALVACQTSPSFTLEGSLTNAEGQTLYLEHTALLGTTTIDSCTLHADGSFSFTSPAGAYPDFYRLRIGAQSLVLAIDSTETLRITGAADSLLYASIQGSEASQAIAQLRLLARTASREALREKAQQVIIANPRSMAAYYAVFMKQEGQYIWNIFDPADRKMYQAVATSMHIWMPNYERTKALYAQVSDILKIERDAKQQIAVNQLIDQAENAVLDIALPNIDGKTQAISDYKGKLLVLDFSAVEMQQRQGYVFELRELYNSYHKRGVEIFSVSLDRNKLLWEDGVTNLPWVNVYAGEQVLEVMTRYNVQAIPTLFLLDRKGHVQGRYSNFEQLDADIRKHL